MSSNNIHNAPAIQDKPADKQQLHMDVDGCKVKLNLPAAKDGLAKIEAVKKMILSGLAKV
jgi:hypothetical protein